MSGAHISDFSICVRQNTETWCLYLEFKDHDSVARLQMSH
jgi:hypothetical protein